MGRITLFTTDDIHAVQIKAALERRCMPFVEISLSEYPEKLGDMLSIASRASSPQVFFNTRFIGGVDATLKELAKWDKPTEANPTPFSRYDLEIRSQPDPCNPRLSHPESRIRENPAGETSVYFPKRFAPLDIDLPDGTKTTMIDMTEKLKSTLVRHSLSSKGTVYLNCFTIQSVLESLKQSLSVSNSYASLFLKRLVAKQIVVPVKKADGETARDSREELYRLQCDATPDILNSYRVWTEPVRTTCSDIVAHLDKMLQALENDNFSIQNGKVDHSLVRTDPRFAGFEEAICELQAVCINHLDQDEMLALGLNVYGLMTRYCFFKLGMCVDESSRLCMQSSIKFNIGGSVFSFQEWIDGILRGNLCPRFSKKPTFGPTDPRRKLALFHLDHRVHFALNLGFWLGGRMSLPFRLFSHEHLNEELDIAARVFCEDDSNLLIKAKDAEVHISKPFMWYRNDFAKKDKDMVAILAKYIHGSKRFTLKKALKQHKCLKVCHLRVDYTTFAQRYAKYDSACLKDRINGFRALFRRFKVARKPENELARLSTLHSLNLLDTLAEERFDRITSMVRAAFEVPIVLVTFVDEDRQWFKSKQWMCAGSAPSETSRDISFCAHTILRGIDGMLEIPDALEDDRFADNPLVREGLQVRYYAGVSLTVPAENKSCGEVNIGTLCILDFRPRKLNSNQKLMLRDYARLVKEEILLRDKCEASAPPGTVSSVSESSISSDFEL